MPAADELHARPAATADLQAREERLPALLAALAAAKLAAARLAAPRLAALAAVGLAAAALAAAALTGAGSPSGSLRLNLSPSLPRGIYRLDAGTDARPGDLVLACVPPRFARLALARHYLSAGDCPGGAKPVGKLLLAIGGDRLYAAAAQIAVNGHALPATSRVAADAGGRPLPHPAPGERRLRRGEIWLVSPHPLSYDSRYFGQLAASAVLGRLAPLAVAGGADPERLAAAIRKAHGGGPGGQGGPGIGKQAQARRTARGAGPAG
jgi:conjugative transfer signal peptidase TraF